MDEIFFSRRKGKFPKKQFPQRKYKYRKEEIWDQTHRSRIDWILGA